MRLHVGRRNLLVASRCAIAVCIALSPVLPPRATAAPGIPEAGASVRPGDRMVSAPLVSPAEARRLRNTARRGMDQIRPMEEPPWFGSPSTASTPEIRALARGLRYEPRLIYENVRNYVDYVPMYGSVKGATMTLLDGEGTDFDQVSLLIALLRESGVTNCSYIYGTIQLDAEAVTNWLGIANKAAVLEALLGAGGIPGAVTPAGEAIDHVVMDHVWAEVNLGGTNCVFDPSFKPYRATLGVDLPAAMQYDRDAFTSNAVQGMITGPSYVQNMNRANVRADLGAYSSNLVAWLSSHRPAASLGDVVGGREIVPVTGQPFQATLPYELTRDERFEHIPEQYETWIGIGFQVTRTFTVSQVYGRRLCMMYAYDGGGLPRQYWILDGERIDDFYDHGMPIILNIDHPYPAFGGTYSDETREFARKPLVDPGDRHLYYISTGWGSTGRRIVEQHRDILAQVLAGSAATNEESVVGETLALIGLEWMAQASRSVELSSCLYGTAHLRHHLIGVVGQEQASGLYRTFMNMVGQSSALSRSAQTNTATAAFYALTQWHSALEWGVIDQMQPGSAVSTIKLLDLANEQSNRVFSAESATYATEVRPYLTNHPTGNLEDFDAVIASGGRLVISENGEIRDGHYHGSGYYELPAGQPAMSCTIVGGLNGGVGTGFSAVDAGYSSRQMKALDRAADNPQSAEPVDLLTGHYLDHKVDLTVGTGALPLGLAFARSYNSGRGHADGPLGRGWSHNLDITASVNSDGFRGLGSVAGAEAAEAIAALYVSMDLLRDGPAMDRLLMTTLAQRWLMDCLISNVVNVVAGEDTAQFLKRGDGTYSPEPRRWARLERQGDGTFRMTSKHGLTFDFDAGGKLATWRDPNSNTVSFSYMAGLLTSVTNHLGRSLHLTYDTNGRVVEVADQTGRGVSYAYDGFGNLTNHTDALGHGSRYEYDVPGRLKRVYHPSDPVTPFVVNAYAGGHVLHLFDPQGEGEADAFIVSSAQVLLQTAFNGQSSAYFYAAPYRSQEVDPDGQPRTWEYDDQGRLVRFTDALANVATFTRDGVERVVSMHGPEGNGLSYAYDARDNLVELVAQPKTGSTAAPLTTTFAYDPTHNRLARAVDVKGRVTDYTYDGSGNLQRIEQPAVAGVRPTFNLTRNGRGQVTEIEGPEGWRHAFTYDPATGERLSRTLGPSALGITQQSARDAVGNIVAVTDARGGVTTLEYDARRRLVRTVAPAPFAYETQRTYDPDGNLTRIRRATGDPQAPWVTHSATYDPGGKPLTVTDPVGRVTTFDYDTRQGLRRVNGPGGTAAGFRYDALGRPGQLLDAQDRAVAAHTYRPGGMAETATDGNTNTVAFQYDDFDRLAKEVQPDGSYREARYDSTGVLTQLWTRAGDVLRVEYDEMNRLKQLTLPGPRPVTYAYDLLGRLTNITAAAGSVIMAYDPVGRLTSSTDVHGRTVQYAYDAQGKRTRLTYPDSFELHYSYDALSRLIGISEGGTNWLVRYGYDALSRLTNSLYGNGVVTACRYSSDGQVSGIQYRFADGPVTFGYAYNDRGLPAEREVSHAEFLFAPTASRATDYTANTLNQYASVGGQACSYDANGNLMSDGVNTYRYDVLGRLTAVSNAQAGVSYQYDALGRRVGRVVDGVVTEFAQDGPFVLAEYNGGGAMVRRYVHGAAPDELVLVQTDGGRWFCHQDTVRSVVALSDTGGHRAESFAYAPWGAPARLSAAGLPFLFNGREYEPETGLYFHRARFYSPLSGRYLSPDPLGLLAGDPNRYTFADNDPVGRLDPFGLRPVPVVPSATTRRVHDTGTMPAYKSKAQSPKDYSKAAETAIVAKWIQQQEKVAEILVEVYRNYEYLQRYAEQKAVEIFIATGEKYFEAEEWAGQQSDWVDEWFDQKMEEEVHAAYMEILYDRTASSVGGDRPLPHTSGAPDGTARVPFKSAAQWEQWLPWDRWDQMNLPYFPQPNGSAPPPLPSDPSTWYTPPPPPPVTDSPSW